MLRYVNNGTVIWLFYFLPQLFSPASEAQEMEMPWGLMRYFAKLNHKSCISVFNKNLFRLHICLGNVKIQKILASQIFYFDQLAVNM